MSDISSIVRNYPNLFTKPSDIMKLCAYYTADDDNERIIIPREIPTYNYGGKSGVPMYYSAENRKVYVDQTDKHSAIIGQTASKKSRLIAMPTVRLLGASGESMIISDPKAEIYRRTASYLRKKGYNVQVLNLRDPARGSAWNPLYVPYQFYKTGDIDRAYEFANDIAVNLTNMEKAKDDAFWDNSAGSFFFGLIALLFKYCITFGEPDEAVSIGNVLNLRNSLCSNTTGFSLQNNPLWKFAQGDPFIAAALSGTIRAPSDTRASILSVFDQKMRAFAIQPSLLNMLANNDIDYSIISEKPTAVYLILPDEKTGYHGLVSLFVKQSYEYMIYLAHIKQNNNGALKIRVNYILDEFSSLPTISDFSAMITAARSRNIRFNLFLQSKHQLHLRYGDDGDTILSNCGNWIFLTSREIDFLKEISELCGECGGSQRKPLLPIADLQRLDKEKGEALLLSGRLKPMITQLADIDFYDDGKPEVSDFNESIIRRSSNIDFEEYINKCNEVEREKQRIENNNNPFLPTSSWSQFGQDRPIIGTGQVLKEKETTVEEQTQQAKETEVVSDDV